MSSVLTIKQMAVDDRPREKFMSQGASALSNSELLAILVGSGNAEESAVDLMRRILSDCGNQISTLQRMSLDQLQGYKGVGPAKAITILAATELARRRMMEDLGEKPRMMSSADIFKFFAPRISHLPHEEAHALYMNIRYQVVGHELIGRGGLNITSVDIRLVMRGALLANASCVALCHNHPSGSLKPSRHDDAITERLAAACKTMDLALIDHVIVSCDGGYYSYSDEGKL